MISLKKIIPIAVSILGVAGLLLLLFNVNFAGSQNEETSYYDSRIYEEQK